MEFLTRTTIAPPPGTPQQEIDDRVALEKVRAAELSAEGTLVRLWRPAADVGSWKNVGLWKTDDESALTLALASLPLYEWMTIDVTPLYLHPNDPALVTQSGNS